MQSTARTKAMEFSEMTVSKKLCLSLLMAAAALCGIFAVIALVGLCDEADRHIVTQPDVSALAA